jgi:TPP-dependent pyruvate/acetoin dehydrogenase alpha subunit
MTASGTTWENPLMPNARLRQIYLAMMQARALAQAVPARRGERSTVGLEACLVSPTVDLGPGDLVSDVLRSRVVDFLRGAPATHSKRRRMTVKCGHAGTLPGPVGSAERIWTAVGAAAALQSVAAQTRLNGDAPPQMGVVVLYLLPGEIPPALLQRSLKFAREKNLPLIFVMLPPAMGPTQAKSARFSDLALRCGIPAIPSDASDAVALYRVAQESIGHARIGGGPAVVECIPFVLTARRTSAPDPIPVLEQYILPRKAVTQAWLNRETKLFMQKIAKENVASK